MSNKDETKSKKNYTSQVIDDGLYTTILESLPIAVLVADSTGALTFINQFASLMTGYSPEELVRGIWMVHPDDTQALSILHNALRKGLPGKNYETRIVRKDGSVFWASISWNPIKDKTGKQTGLCTTFTDISDRIQSQEALEHANERYRMFAEDSCDVFWEMDPDGTFSYVSPALQKLGYDPAELVGRNIVEFLPPDKVPAFVGHLTSVPEKPQSALYEIRVRRKDGSYIPLEVMQNSVIRDGVLVKIHGVARDITQRNEVNRELEQAHERYQALAENGTDVLFAWELDGTITYMSPSIKQLGYTPEEWIGRPILDITDPEIRPQLIAMAEQQARDLQPNRHELRLVAKDGTIVPFETQVDVVVRDGVPVRKQAVARDITARKAAEDALRLSEARYKGIVENSNDLIMLTSPEGKITYASPASREIIGWEPEEAVAENPWFAHPDDNEITLPMFALALQGTPGPAVEYRIVTKAGETKWVSHSYSPILEGDKVLTVVSVVRDVTERKHSEETLQKAQVALEESEQKYKSIVENSKDLILLNLPEGPITYASPALLDMLGYEPEDFVGKMPDTIHPDDFLSVKRAFEHAATGESKANFEYRVKTKSGDTKWVSHTWSPIYCEDHLQSIISIVRDITERKESEQQLKRAHEELEQAYKLQSEFLNNVTHEVRTPLTAVQGYTEMLMEGIAGPVTEEQSALLQKVVNSSEHLLDVLNAVLQTARMKSGRIALRPRVSDPRLIAKTCIETVLPQAQRKGLSINLNPDPNGTVATYDGDKLTLILTNLLGNAVKFTASGSIDVFVAAQQDGCEIIVSDTGIGIAGSRMVEIFDEFRQLEYPGKHKATGFGLGLSIVAAMVEAIGASLIVSSKKNLGTAFTLWVPVLEP